MFKNLIKIPYYFIVLLVKMIFYLDYRHPKYFPWYMLIPELKSVTLTKLGANSLTFPLPFPHEKTSVNGLYYNSTIEPNNIILHNTSISLMIFIWPLSLGTENIIQTQYMLLLYCIDTSVLQRNTPLIFFMNTNYIWDLDTWHIFHILTHEDISDVTSLISIRISQYGHQMAGFFWDVSI